MTIKPISILSYNIHKGMSPLNRLVQLPKIEQALAGVSADILCLQEVQGAHNKRAKNHQYPTQPQHEWLAKSLALNAHYGKNASYKQGHHGNVTLSRFALDFKENVNITVNRFEKRGILHCQILPTDWQTPVSLLNVHLNLLEKDRQKQYLAIKNYLRHAIDDDKPLILAGDFNDWQKNAPACLADLGLSEVCIKRHNKCLATFPARLPLLSLDRVFVRHLKVEQATVLSGAPWDKLSDHLPILALLAPDER